MALVEQTTFLGEIFGRFGYLAPFLVLLLCGVGLPLPEEVTLIGSGLLLYRGEVEFVPIVLVCGSAILLGDSVPYFLGRKYGTSALRIPWVARLVHPERFDRLQRRFAEHGNLVTFGCRFVAGIRIPGYFIAGTMGMSYGRFLMLDSLGVLISVPVSIYLGKLFGDSVDTLKERFHDFHLILAFLVLSLVLILVVRHRRRLGALAAGHRAPAADADGASGPEPRGGAAGQEEPAGSASAGTERRVGGDRRASG